MKKDRGEGGISECVKDCALGGKCVLGVSGWTILVSICWADSRDLEERERRKPDPPDPEGVEGQWWGEHLPSGPAGSPSTELTSAGAARQGGSPRQGGA